MIVLDEEAVTSNDRGAARRNLGYWATWLAAATMFLVVTRGPVFWVRLEAGPLTNGLLGDRWIQATFVASSLLVIALAMPAARLLWADRRVFAAFAAFQVFILLTTLWSVTPGTTFDQSLMFLLSTAAALLAGVRLRPYDALLALWLAMQVGVGISIFARVRDWPGSQFYDYLLGIYLNKNSLGPVALMGVAASVALVFASFRRGLTLLVLPPALVAIGVDGYVWYRTNSFGPLVALSVGALVVVVLGLSVPGPMVWLRRAGALLFLVAAGAVALVTVLNRAELNESLGRTSTLTGRTGIWDVVLDYAAERPVHGWGFLAVWEQPDIIDSLAAAGRLPVFEAHSGYLEVLLGAGLIGLGLLVLVLVVAMARITAAAWWTPSPLKSWSLFLAVYALATNLGESFIGPNLLPWVVLCLATGHTVSPGLRALGAMSPRPATVRVPVVGLIDADDDYGSTVPFERFDFSFESTQRSPSAAALPDQVEFEEEVEEEVAPDRSEDRDDFSFDVDPVLDATPSPSRLAGEVLLGGRRQIEHDTEQRG